MMLKLVPGSLVRQVNNSGMSVPTSSLSELFNAPTMTSIKVISRVKPSRVAFLASASESSSSSTSSPLSFSALRPQGLGPHGLRPQGLSSVSFYPFVPSLSPLPSYRNVRSLSLLPHVPASPSQQQLVGYNSSSNTYHNNPVMIRDTLSLLSLANQQHRSSYFPNRPSRHVQYIQQRGNSNFIRQVMEQVKKEMESNEKLRQSMKELRESKLTESSSELKEKLGKAGESVKIAFGKMKHGAGRLYIGTCDMVSRVKLEADKKYETYSKYKQESAVLRGIGHAMSMVANVTKSSVSSVVRGTKNLLDFFKDEKAEEAKKRVEEWRANMERKRETGEEEVSEHVKTAEPDETTYALIISQDSAWDRFGTKLRDMPFLQNFFENPMLGHLLGETTQAAALREMRVIDPAFRLPELVELMEHIIAPHLVHSFLNGDRDTLNVQCGEAAFAAIDHSIKERDALKLALDPTVLLLRNIELKAQQINCMRDKDGKVIVGAVDDIREVVYSVAVTKHPDPGQPGLSYPWQVT